MEVNKNYAAILVLASVGLWCFAVVLSSKLAGKEIKPGSHRARLASGGEDRLLVSPESARLREEAEANPGDKRKLLGLAESLQRDAKLRPSPGLVMEAVQAYSRVLELNKDDPDALLGLATLCFEADIIDKALEYFRRYLAERPDDLQTATDYALALIQGREPEKAIEFLAPISAKHPERFQMHLTLAVAEKILGHPEPALRRAEQALKSATTEDAKRHIEDFIRSLNSGSVESGGDAPDVRARAGVSAASVVQEYFSAHPIIGPKLKRIVWPSANMAQIAVENFPVESMPAFAREKFLKSAAAALGVIPEDIQIELVDAESEKVLLAFTAGKK